MNILDKIVALKRLEVARLPHEGISAELLAQCGPRRDFIGALKLPRRAPPALVAEVKKASPSAGVICEDFEPVRIAKAYEAAGAACLSVLTDEKFFQGSLDYLSQIRRAVDIPLLRKDFIIDERQIPQSLKAGADAVLLIASIVDRLGELHLLARIAGLTVLVEVHDEEEMDRAIKCEAQLIGVNNRDLKTFKVDLATTERLANRLRNSGHKALLVAESGIATRADVERLRSCGADAILVGESLMRHGNIAEKVAELL
jgi:indole-3-glycerol phosphate synthase